MSNTVSTSVANPVRTGLQGGAAWVVTEGIDAFLYDMDDRQYGVALVGLAMVFSFIQNVAENHFGVGLFRRVPEPDQPVVDK
jgi:hypothetical protein